jgi:hypothetical protein
VLAAWATHAEHLQLQPTYGPPVFKNAPKERTHCAPHRKTRGCPWDAAVAHGMQRWPFVPPHLPWKRKNANRWQPSPVVIQVLPIKEGNLGASPVPSRAALWHTPSGVSGNAQGSVCIHCTPLYKLLTRALRASQPTVRSLPQQVQRNHVVIYAAHAVGSKSCK